MSIPSDSKTERNQTADLLRCIGLFLVIAAHCSFPDWFYEFREFDVVLLFFVSGMSFVLSAGRHAGLPYKAYVLHRFRRLILPVWCFLAGFFALFALTGHGFSPAVMLKSFLLLSGGILFVWVFRVFFTTSLLNPLSAAGCEKTVPLTGSLFLAAGILLNDGLTAGMRLTAPGAVYKVFEVLVSYTIAYALVSFAGMLFIRAEKKARIRMAVLYGTAFLVSWGIQRFGPVSQFKYPPAFCYCMYGLFVSAVLYLLLEHVRLQGKAADLIFWLSRQSLNIYMWHILLYYVSDTWFPAVTGSGMIEYLIFLGGGILLAAGAQFLRTAIGKNTL